VELPATALYARAPLVYRCARQSEAVRRLTVQISAVRPVGDQRYRTRFFGF
jgi:hypothetical protein